MGSCKRMRLTSKAIALARGRFGEAITPACRHGDASIGSFAGLLRGLLRGLATGADMRTSTPICNLPYPCYPGAEHNKFIAEVRR